MKLTGEDAVVIINALDKVSRSQALVSVVATRSSPPSLPPIRPKVLKENQVPLETKLHAFKLMQKLAGASCQVPKSYLIGGAVFRLQVEKTIVAYGGSADIRKGRYKEMNVAVKTIRTSQQSDIEAIHEVRRAVRCSILDD